jgi:hypothetical protein
LYSAFEDLIKPGDILEDMLVAEIAAAVWEMLRLRRFKALVIETSRRSALCHLLAYRLQVTNREDAEKLSDRFFSEDSARTEVSQILQKFNLDERAIEAEAIRDVLDELERADKMLMLAETRRERALRLVADYRQELAHRCKHASDVVLKDGVNYAVPAELED